MRSLSDNPELNLQAKLDSIELSAIASMVPNVERARGRVEASIDVSGDWKAPRFQGQISVGDGAISVRGFPIPTVGKRIKDQRSRPLRSSLQGELGWTGTACQRRLGLSQEFEVQGSVT